MNTLKKALTKDDPKKYTKSKIQISSIRQSNKYKDIESMMLKKKEKSQCDNIQEQFRKIVENNFQNGDIKDVAKLYKELQEKYYEFYPHQTTSVALHNIVEELRNTCKSQQSAMFRKYIDITCEKIIQFVQDKQTREKNKCLEQFNKLLKNSKGGNKKDDQNINKALNKLIHSTSATNLKIKVRRDEYQLQEDENPLRRKKSLDFKNVSKVSSHSSKKLDAGNKLQQLLKDTNIKLVKTKIQYDFSAIFQASNKNIQPRNKTAFITPKTEKQVLAKATKGKRDEAFVFYRPKKKY